MADVMIGKRGFWNSIIIIIFLHFELKKIVILVFLGINYFFAVNAVFENKKCGCFGFFFLELIIFWQVKWIIKKYVDISRACSRYKAVWTTGIERRLCY